VKLGSPVAAQTVAGARAAKKAKARSKAQNLFAIVKDIERSRVTPLSGIAVLSKPVEFRPLAASAGPESKQPFRLAR
jgi:hypothetical protein